MAPPGPAMLPGAAIPGQLPGVPQTMPGVFPNMFPFGTSQFGALPLMPAQAMTQQATRHARRVYVGGLPPMANEQVDNLRKHVHSCGLTRRIDLVVTSPLLRTMQTTVGVFGSESYEDGMDAPPLMVANAGNSGRHAYSNLNCPPFITVEECREHLAVRPCDRTRSISKYE